MLSYHRNIFILLHNCDFLKNSAEKQSLVWAGGGEMPIVECVAAFRTLLWAVSPYGLWGGGEIGYNQSCLQGVDARRGHHPNPPALAQLPSQHMQGA